MDATLPPRAQVEDVRFFPQARYQCGPAALAGVLASSGVATDAEQLVPQVYLPGRRGSLQVELLAAARRHGRIAFVLLPRADALFAEVAAGRPVLVLQNLGLPALPRWHYAVVTGYDLERGQVVLNSGRREARRQPLARFLRTWEGGGAWAMVALTPTQLPVQAEALGWLDAVSSFEAVAACCVEAAYRAAARRWPQDHRTQLALGNLEYARGELASAQRHYARGLTLEPGDAVLANNLASVLGDRGCAREGLALLEPRLRALPENSTWRDALQRTRAELEQELDRTAETPDGCAGIADTAPREAAAATPAQE